MEGPFPGTGGQSKTNGTRGFLPGPLGRIASAFYSGAIGRINRRFDNGRGVVTLDRPVISVGNLSVGGTGKTPMVLHILRTLIAAGHSPCVAMRGYASRGGQSDEASVYAGAIPDLPIVARPDRTTGLIELFGTPEGERVDVVVLDDGFQHRQIARQLDIVLIDATHDPFADRLIPAGRLREPVSSLARAGAIVLTHAERVDGRTLDALRARCASANPGAVVAAAEHAWSGLVSGLASGERVLPASHLRGKRVHVACAIGNPEAFIAQARETIGIEPAGTSVLRDHDPYEWRTIGRLLVALRESRAEVLLVTEKDWVKLRRVKPEAWPCEVLRPVLEMRFRTGEVALAGLVLATGKVEPE